MNSPRDAYIAEVTAGLKGDPELRRDVGAELASHLDAAFDEARAGGRTEEESMDAALKALGNPVTLAGDLVDANRGRMRLRTVLRVAVGALLVPAAVVLALWMTRAAAERAQIIMVLTSAFSGSASPGFFSYEKTEQKVVSRWRLGPRERIVVFGDRTKSTRTEQQKALCDLDPSNRIFRANYIRYLLTDCDAKRMDTEEFLAELGAAEELDPDNAYYNYLAAGVMAGKATEWVVSDEGTNSITSLLIRDTNLLDRAMDEFQRGVAKPFCKAYASDLLALRRSLLPSSENMGDEVVKIGLTAGVLLPHLSHYRNLARVLRERMSASAQAGHKVEATQESLRLVQFAEDLVSDAWSLIDILVAQAIIGIAEKQVVTILDQAGMHEEAADLRVRAEAAAAPVKTWRESVKNSDPSVWEGKAGVLAALLLSSIGSEGITDAELEPGRRLDRIMGEQALLMNLILVFLTLILVAGLLALRWRRVKGSESAPFLILPGAGEAALIVSVSVVLPVALYGLYSRFSGLSGREFAVTSNLPRFIVELGSLGLFILVFSIRLSLRHVKRRCVALGVPVPSSAWAWLAVWRSDHGLYLGTAARSLIPTFAAAILLLAGAVQPWLAHEETRWMRVDHLLSQDNAIGGFTSVETRLVNRLKSEMLEALRRADPEAKGSDATNK